MGPRGPVNRGHNKTSARRRRFDRIETESAMFVWHTSHGRGCKTRAIALSSPVAASERGAAMYHSTGRAKRSQEAS